MRAILRSPGRLRPSPFVALAAFSLAATAVHAQAVSGVFVDPQTGAPVRGAHVVLRDAAGHEASSANTDAAGRFVVRAGSPGRYVLRGERIGYQATLSAPMELAAGQTVEYRMVGNATGVGLQGFVVAGRARCVVTAGAGPQTAVVWEEARKALRSAQAAADARLYLYDARVYERSLDPHGTVLADESVNKPGVGGTPFVTVPISRLTRSGYVEMDGDTLVYHAPDAAALLSDDFQDQHCFRLVAPPAGEEGLIGLAFQPVPGRKLTDIQGTLWLDRATAELRRMEYQYTGMRARRPSDEAGGRLDFRPLPSGDWIVSRWRIRMPLMAAERVAPVRAAVPNAVPSADTVRYRLVGLKEEGGEVATISTRSGQHVDVDPGATLAGVVFDSTRSAPLVHARVVLAGTSLAAQTDSAGRFLMHDLPEGHYTLSFESPRADSLGYEPAGVPVALTRGATTTQNLVLPAQALAAAQANAPVSARVAALERMAAARDSVHGTVRLNTVHVVGRNSRLEYAGFYERQKLGHGTFVGDSVIQANPTARLDNVLRRVAGLRVVQYSPPAPTAARMPTETRFASSRSNTTVITNSPCFLTVYLDGVKIMTPDPGPQGDVLSNFPISSISGIEVYLSELDVPTKYHDGSNSCGIVLMWTRDHDTQNRSTR